MNEFGQVSGTQAAVAPAPGQEPALAWDRLAWLVTIPLAVLVTYAFVPVLDNDFLLIDDDEIIVGNPHLRGLGIAQVKWAWTSLFSYYQPLAKMLFQRNMSSGNSTHEATTSPACSATLRAPSCCIS